MKRKVTKAVITAAGYGTRFLPATKNVPKELLPIINKPTIAYIVDQCVAAGIEDIIIVTRFGNHAVEDYFDSEPTLENYLNKKGKTKLEEEIKSVYKSANFIFMRQKADLPYGNAAPLYSVKNLIKDEPFVFSWGDDITIGEGAGVEELVNSYNNKPCDVILNCLRTTKEEISRVGAEVRIKEGTSDVVEEIIEKPPLEEVTSDLLSVAPYLLTSKIFDYLDPSVDQRTGEFLFQKGVEGILKDNGDVRVSVTSGKWLTMGDPLNYLKATVEMALIRDDLRDDFLAYLKSRVKELNGI
ncbi:NTP transferase domain-containing protein [Candidatus Woesebacteria bacterium]|nr:MAG: NTP transferase domain-containing protein [Candidatus Woesebacteria bacterium]